MINTKARNTIEDLSEMDECPCDVCNSQDNQNQISEKQKFNEVCDLFSNYLIDYLIVNHKEDLLQQSNNQVKFNK